MRKIPFIFPLLTLLWPTLTHLPLLASATSQDTDDFSAWERLRVDHNKSIFEVYSMGALMRSLTPVGIGETPPQDRLSGYYATYLAKNDRLLVWSVQESARQHVSSGALSSHSRWSSTTPNGMTYDQLIGLYRKQRQEFHGVINDEPQVGPDLFGKRPFVIERHKCITQSTPQLLADHVLLISSGPIDLSAHTFSLEMLLASTPTGLYIHAHPGVKDPLITGITFYPKISYYEADGQMRQGHTLCVRGNIDFEAGTYKVEASNIERVTVHFNKNLRYFFQRETLTSYGITPPEKTDSNGQHLYNMALKYRDGKEGFPQDSEKAEQIFYNYLEIFGAPVVSNPELYAKAHHNLGMLAYKQENYPLAEKHFRVAGDEGFEVSKRNILQMRIHRQLPVTLEESFLALCDYHGYTLPVARDGFRFWTNMSESHIDNSGVMGHGEGGMCLKSAHNFGYGLLSAPVIWITQDGGLTGDGRVEAQLLVVGQKKIDLKK